MQNKTILGETDAHESVYIVIGGKDINMTKRHTYPHTDIMPPLLSLKYPKFPDTVVQMYL